MRSDIYTVFNRTKSAWLAHNAEAADSIFKRIKGLIGRSEVTFGPGQAFWIKPSDGIHTLGMRFPIDAVYLDSEGRVIRLYHQLKPYRIAAIVLKAKSVLELPPGTLVRTGTVVGDLLEFQAK